MNTKSLAEEVSEYQSALAGVVEKAREEEIPFGTILRLVEGFGTIEGVKISDVLAEKIEQMAKERRDVAVVLREGGETPEGAQKVLEEIEKEVVDLRKHYEKDRVRVLAFNDKSRKAKLESKDNDILVVKPVEEGSFTGSLKEALGFLRDFFGLSKLRTAFGGAADGSEDPSAPKSKLAVAGDVISKFFGGTTVATAASSIKPDEPKPPSSTGMV